KAVGTIASDDPTRFNLAGVYVDPKGYIVASDGHRLCAAPGNPRGVKADAIYDDAGRKIEGQFPDYSQVVPGPKQRKLAGTLSVPHLEAFARTPSQVDPGAKGVPTVLIRTKAGETWLSAEYMR